MALRPSLDQSRSLIRLMQAYDDLLGWLDQHVPAGHSDNLVSLHRGFYERARQAKGLPARLVSLAFKDWVLARRGQRPAGVPVDDKLYAVKGIDTVSLSTLDGRMTMPFVVAGYEQPWLDPAPARLVARPDDEMAGTVFELQIELERHPEGAPVSLKEEIMVTTETALSRIGRVIAGMAHAAIDAAEGSQPETVMSQALRDIDQAAEEVRAELGKATAERYRLDLRRKELEAEGEELTAKVQLAVDGARDDLAEAGIARQIDIEAQVNVLDRLMEDVEERIAQFNQTMDAVSASRREAEERLHEFRQSRQHVDEGAVSHSGGSMSRALNKVERAKAATVRVTGVPAEAAAATAPGLKALEELSRERDIKERLARFKSSNHH